MRNKRVFLTAVLTVFFVSCAVPSRAEEFYCEVMSVEGTATVTNQTVDRKQLAEGDTLQAEDLVEIGADSSLDLAYDRDWNNVTRVEENSKLRIRSLYPTTVELEGGGVYAKLKSLPKESSFSVQTPTAIASVRGTEYRTTYVGGETEVSNASDSDVYVYGLDSEGAQQAEPVVIRRSEKTQIIARGLPPMGPRPMEARDLERVQHFQQGIEKKVNDNIAKGRFAKIPDIKSIEDRQREMGPHKPLAGRLEGPGRKLTPEQELKRNDGRPGRNIPETMSGDEARQAAQGVTDGPRSEERRSEFSQGHEGPPRQEAREGKSGLARQEGMSRLLGSPDGDHDPNGAGAGGEGHRPAQGQGHGESGERQGRASENRPDHGHEMGMRAQQDKPGKGSSGQPFGPDPGRRPKDMGQGHSDGGNAPKKGAAPRPAPRPSNNR